MPPHPDRVRRNYEMVPVTVTDRTDTKEPWRWSPLIESDLTLGELATRWRAPHQNAAEQLARRAFVTDRDCGDEDVK